MQAQFTRGSPLISPPPPAVYVGNVDYSCTPEELQMHFQSCGTVNRVTILTGGGLPPPGPPKPDGFVCAHLLLLEQVAEGQECRRAPQTRASSIRPGMRAGFASVDPGLGRARERAGVNNSCIFMWPSSQSLVPAPALPSAADKMGNPKGFAYIEFLEADAVANACLLDGSELRNRSIKASAPAACCLALL